MLFLFVLWFSFAQSVQWTKEFVQPTADPFRPQFHVMPETNWMNDPNGPMYYKGVYHLFYQYNPDGAAWGNMHWGHAASYDLAHWFHLPIALKPDQKYDSAGVFSGSATIREDGTPVILYTGQTNVEQQCIALPVNVSDPLLVQWTKPSYNPIIPTPPPNVDPVDFRDDTTLWQANGKWWMLVGATLAGNGAALLYSTVDFKTFKYEHPLFTTGTLDSMWECPDFFPIGDKYVLKISALNTDYWTIGDLDTDTQYFTSTSEPTLLDNGASVYASKSFYDPVKKRQIMWSWLREEDSNGVKRGWQGTQSIPREISIDDELNIVLANPIEEMKMLRSDENGISYKNVKLGPSQWIVPGVYSNQLEINVTFRLDLRQQTTFGVNVLVSNDTQTFTSIAFDYKQFNAHPMNNTDMPGGDYRDFNFGMSTLDEDNIPVCQQVCADEDECKSWTYVKATGSKPPRCSLKNTLPFPVSNTQCVSSSKVQTSQSYITLSRDHSGTDGNTDIVAAPFPLKKSDDSINLRVFVDHSVVEVFAQGGRIRISSRVYPADTTAMNVSLFSLNSPAIANITVWHMNSCWKSSH